MKEVYFKDLLIADLQNHTARYQRFEKGLNVVTSVDNHVGKSSLLKSLYYTLGAEIEFDSVWDKHSKLYVVTLSVDEKEYRVVRLMKRFAVFEGKRLLKLTESVTKDLAQLLSKIFDFAVYLPNKETGKVEMAPPAFTFMPYYIDQDKGWSGLYESFASINQYKRTDRIKSLYYHLNIYTKQTVELMAEKDRLKEKVESLQTEEKRLNTILSALQGEIDNLPPAETVQELDMQLVLPQKRIEKLVSQIGEIRNEIQILETSVAQHEYQLNIIKEYVSLKSDTHQNKRYIQHVCPNCGYLFDEEIFDLVKSNYSSTNEDYMCQQIELLIKNISQKLENAKNHYVKLQNQLKIEEQAYKVEKDTFDVYIRQRGLKSSITRFQNQLGYVVENIKDTEQQINDIAKELKKLPNKKEVEDKYIEYTRLNIMILGAWDSAYENTIRLLKPIKAQGTLENKIILAQFVGLFQTMEYFKSEATRFPFVIDSPRAKEASKSSSMDILKMISDMKMLPQIILATIDYSAYEGSIAPPAEVIVLTEKRKLLNKADYLQKRETIISLAELLRNYQS